MMRRALAWAVAAVMAGCSTGGPGGLAGGPAGGLPRQTPGVMERTVGEETFRLRYLLYLPEGYGLDAGRRWPLMLFLHGAGERGADLELVTKHGPPMEIARGRSLPFIVASPQCPKKQWWDPNALEALLDELGEQYAVDEDRVVVTGLSMGGFATWALAGRDPDRYAAIVPICGGGDPERAARLRYLPTRVYHGGKDRVVPVKKSREMVDAMRAAGAEDVRFTVVPEAGHVCWVKPYADPDLYAWLLARSRDGRPRVGEAGN